MANVVGKASLGDCPGEMLQSTLHSFVSADDLCPISSPTVRLISIIHNKYDK